MSANCAIDSHVHVWTPNVVAYPLAAGYSVAQMRPPSFTPEEFLPIARPLGVERAVLIQMDFYGFDNSFLLDMLQLFHNVFVGVAQIDERGPDPAGAMLRLKTRGIRGVRIMPTKRGEPSWLDSPGMQAMWQSGAEERIAICPLIETDDLPALARMCHRFPVTPVVVDHAANIGGDGQFRETDVKSLCELGRFDNVYVKVSAFYYLGRKLPPYDDVVPMVRRLVESFGPQRLMWGSDSPFQLQPPNTYQASLEFVRDRLDFMTLEDKDWLLHRTAAGVFFS